MTFMNLIDDYEVILNLNVQLMYTLIMIRNGSEACAQKNAKSKSAELCCMSLPQVYKPAPSCPPQALTSE